MICRFLSMIISSTDICNNAVFSYVSNFRQKNRWMKIDLRLEK